ncbi:MAG: hypothetical protein AAF721_08685 [Myxococcota bacterium]
MVRLGLCTLALAVGCGPTVSVPGSGMGGGSEGDGTSGTDGLSAGDDGVAEVGDDETGATTDGLDTGNGSEEAGDDGPDPVPGHCGTALDDAVGVGLLDGSATLLSGDGSTVALATLGGVPADAGFWEWVASNDDTIAVALDWSTFGPNLAAAYELHVFDRSGQPRWQFAEANARLYSLAVGVDGSVVGQRETIAGANSTVHFATNGDATSIPDFQPYGATDETGRIAGREKIGEELGELGWYDTTTASFVPVSETPSSPWFLRREGGFVYRTEAALIVETPASVQTIPLGSFSESSVRTIQGDWAILYDGATDAHARLQLSDGQVEPLDLTPPPGWEHFICYGLDATIDAQGRLLMPMRNEAVAQLQRYDVDAGSWETIGEPVTAVDQLTSYTVTNSVAIITHGSGQTFCPTTEFEAAPGALEGQQTQFAAGDALYLLPSDRALSVRDDGECLAHLDQRGGTVVLDPASGLEHTVAPANNFVFTP